MAPSDLDPREMDAERLRLIDRGRSSCGWARRLSAELRKMDPYVEGVRFISDRIAGLPPEESAPGVVAGRWHVLVKPRDPQAQMMFWPLCGPEGEYVEPPLGAFIEDMKRSDLWRPGALEDLRKRHERELREADRASETAREARIEQGAHTFRAAKRVAGEGGMLKRLWSKGRLIDP